MKKVLKIVLAIICWIVAIICLVEAFMSFKDLDSWGLGFTFYILPIGIIGILFLLEAIILTKGLINKKEIPNSVLEYGFDFDWDEKDVWKLEYPTQEIDIEILEWHFDIPFWNWNNEWYVLKPRDVINNSKKFKSQYDRIMETDISYPIDIMENKGRFVILDGLHRLVKCKLLGMNKVKVRIIPRSEIPNISR